MKEREELELILRLIRKYNLPLSPILEYAVNEKMEEYPETDNAANEAEIVTEDLSSKEDVEKPINLPSHDDVQQPSIRGYYIDNSDYYCYIISNNGERVFSSSGKLKIIDEEFYRVRYNDTFVSMNLIKRDDRGAFVLSKRVFLAQKHSPLRAVFDKVGYLDQIKAVRFDNKTKEYHVQVENRWYGSSGYYADLVQEDNNTISGVVVEEELNENHTDSASDELEIEHVFLDPSGNIINSVTTSSIDLTNDLAIGNRKGQPWTDNEEELIKLYFKQGLDFSKIASRLGRTEVSIKSRLGKLGLIDYVFGQDEESIDKSEEESKQNANERDYTIENSFISCYILNKNGDRIYSTEGKLIFLNGNLYLLKIQNDCFTVKKMDFNGDTWKKGAKKIVAYPQSELYRIIDSALNCCEIVQDIEDSDVFEECRLKVNGLWYNYDGTIFEPNEDKEKEIEIEKEGDAKSNDYPGFSVKIGDRLKVFPSQIIGTVTNLRVDSWGHKIIIVKSDKGELVSVYDSKYLYQKIYKKENKPSPEKQNTRIYGDEMRVSPIYDSKVRNGSWIQWKPTGTVGRVVGFKSVGSVQKIVLRRKDGTEIEVYDNPKAYDIIKR